MSSCPSSWSEAEREHWWRIEKAEFPGNPPAFGQHGAVTTTNHALATRVGLGILQEGGSAVDAVLAAALVQTTLGVGDVISFFGILGLVHHDTKTGKTMTLSAPWKTCREDQDLASIPVTQLSFSDGLRGLVTGVPNGRAILVGGFMKAVEAAHARFGKLPFARLFDASIELAEQGFPLGRSVQVGIEVRGEALARLPETKAIFYKADGTPYRAGDIIRQPALAKTLRAIASQGAAYMYEGPWAKACVEAVRREGGKMTLADLADYQPSWSEPVVSHRHGYDLALIGGPACQGSYNLIEALNLADAAGIRAKGHWSKSVESLRALATLGQAAFLSFLPPGALPPPYNTLDFTPANRLTPEHAEALWSAISMPGSFMAPAVEGSHSDTVVAGDAEGTLVSLCHSSNNPFWGATALMVDGISVHDAAGFKFRPSRQPVPAAMCRCRWKLAWS